jgi:hypothetical protein
VPGLGEYRTIQEVKMLKSSVTRMAICWIACGILSGCISAISAAALSAKEAAQTVDRAAAQAVFEKIKMLSGRWRGKSTRGWEEDSVAEVIAKGTVVTMRSAEPDPDSAMMSVFQMDGGRLLLTHYCEAGNQPRLVATSVEENGRKITFTFLDGTNMASRNVGHMDKLVFTLLDENHFTEQWTWYQNGSERWLEVIENQRTFAGKSKGADQK